jgi:hypothetical protein
MSDEDDFFLSEDTHRASASREPEVPRVDPSRYVQHLTQAWINERAAPDILQYEQASVDGLVNKIEEQVPYSSGTSTRWNSPCQNVRAALQILTRKHPSLFSDGRH